MAIKEQTAQEILKAHESELINLLLARARSPKHERSLHLAVNKLVPDAKQQIELEGSLTVIHKTNIPEKELK